MGDGQPYTVESPTRIRLGPDAKYWAEQHGMTLDEFAKYLLRQHHHHGEGESQSIETPEVEVHNVNLVHGFKDGGKVERQPPAAPPTRESRYLNSITDKALKETK